MTTNNHSALGSQLSAALRAVALLALGAVAPVAHSGESAAPESAAPEPVLHAAHSDATAGMPASSSLQMPLFDNLGTHTHEISTSSAAAQSYFNQGYRFLFNFNHAAAIASFREALRRDADCAMCWWGIAFAYGPNINMPMMPDAIAPAYAAVQKALALNGHANAAEKAYIAALAKRYSQDPQADRAALDRAFAAAMREVVHAYPDDLDAATLYAESLMDTAPWNYWQADKRTPTAGLEDLEPTLQSVLKRQPDHPGAEHLFIHAVEASADPGRAEAAADRLGAQMPGAGHLVHMPSHIYNRVGRYADGVSWNEKAAKADEDYFAATDDRGMYLGMYFVHNLHFIWTTASTEGRSVMALDAARRVVAATPLQMAHDMPPMELFLPTKLLAQLRFAKWQEVLATAAPDSSFHFATAMWRYARARAFAAKHDIAHARQEQAKILSAFPAAEDQRFTNFGVPGLQLVQIAAHVAQADIYRAQKNLSRELSELRSVVTLQDGLPYMEPPYWDFPVREHLGAALLAVGRAKEAESVYRKDLAEWPKNGWSLLGLSQALEQQGKKRQAVAVRAQFRLAWARADVQLTHSRF